MPMPATGVSLPPTPVMESAPVPASIRSAAALPRRVSLAPMPMTSSKPVAVPPASPRLKTGPVPRLTLTPPMMSVPAKLSRSTPVPPTSVPLPVRPNTVSLPVPASTGS